MRCSRILRCNRIFVGCELSLPLSKVLRCHGESPGPFFERVLMYKGLKDNQNYPSVSESLAPMSTAGFDVDLPNSAPIKEGERSSKNRKRTSTPLGISNPSVSKPTRIGD